jgi:hypothetical protein
MKNVFIWTSCCLFLACGSVECMKKDQRHGEDFDETSLSTEVKAQYELLKKDPRAMGRVAAANTMYLRYNVGLAVGLERGRAAVEQGRTEGRAVFGRILSIAQLIPPANGDLGWSVRWAIVGLLVGNFSKDGFTRLSNAIDAVSNAEGSGFGDGTLQEFRNSDAWTKKLIGGKKLFVVHGLAYPTTFLAKVKGASTEVAENADQAKDFAYASMRKMSWIGKKSDEELLSGNVPLFVEFFDLLSDMFNHSERYCPPAHAVVEAEEEEDVEDAEEGAEAAPEGRREVADAPAADGAEDGPEADGEGEGEGGD